MNLTRYEVGTLSVPDGKLDVTDPCFAIDVWCRINSVAVVPGEYICVAWTSKFKDWGKRTLILTLVNSKWSEENRVDNNSWEEIGFIGVDAGLAGFFISPHDMSEDQSVWYGWLDDMENYNEGSTYLSTEGFWSSSGFGDGEYGVYAIRNDDSRIVALEIRF